MKILGLILAFVATVTSQNVDSVLNLVEQPQFPPVQPLTPFNVASDGLIGYDPYANGVGVPPPVPQILPPNNNVAPLPYQFPIAYPYPVYPNPTYPQFPIFPQYPQFFPQRFPQIPNPFQPTVQPAFPPQIIQYGAPAPNAVAVSYTNYQTHTTSPLPQPPKPAIAQAQGVNGPAKPVTNSLGNSNQAYGSAFGKYVAVPAATSNQAARYEAVSGSTVHTAALPGHEMDYKVVSGQPVTVTPASN